MTLHPPKDARYLGDGVYGAVSPGGEVKLWTEREEGTHWMVLGAGEVEALLALLRWYGWDVEELAARSRR